MRRGPRRLSSLILRQMKPLLRLLVRLLHALGCAWGFAAEAFSRGALRGQVAALVLWCRPRPTFYVPPVRRGDRHP